MSKFTRYMGRVVAKKELKEQGFSQQRLEEAQRKRGTPGEVDFWAAFSRFYGGVGEQRQQASLTRRRGFGQVDLSMVSPGLLQLILQQQRERQTGRRKQRRHAVIGGMGFAPSGRKTLLGE